MSGADALIAVDERTVAGFVAAPDRNDFVFETRRRRRRRSLFDGCERANLSCSSREMPCVWARNSAVMPIISAALLVRVKELGVEVDAGIHRNVVHVLEAADDLHILEHRPRSHARPERLPAGCCRTSD